MKRIKRNDEIVNSNMKFGKSCDGESSRDG